MQWYGVGKAMRALATKDLFYGRQTPRGMTTRVRKWGDEFGSSLSRSSRCRHSSDSSPGKCADKAGIANPHAKTTMPSTEDP